MPVKRTLRATLMRRVLGMLSSLTVMVALSAGFADDPSQFTPEQQEIASEVVDGLGQIAWEILGPWLGFGEIVQGKRQDDIDADLENGFGEIQQLLRIELLFARKACDLSDEEFQALSQS